MNIVSKFKKKKEDSRNDLHNLELLSQEILNFLNSPYILKPSLTKTEKKNLNTLLASINVKIVKLTVRPTNLKIKLNIRGKGVHHG